MQIFMPYDNFYKSLICLDKKRCFKQLVEVSQICATHDINVPKKNGGFMKPAYINHPIHNIWEGCQQALMYYRDICLSVCLQEHKINTTMEYFDERGLQYYKYPINESKLKLPELYGYKPFHDSHKSNLLRKHLEHYKQFGWNVPNDLEYIWKK